MENKYKIGDKVWVRNDIKQGDRMDGNWFIVNQGEIDIRGALVEILKVDGDGYNVLGYKSLHDCWIDHEKTAQGVEQKPNYEVY